MAIHHLKEGKGDYRHKIKHYSMHRKYFNYTIGLTYK